MLEKGWRVWVREERERGRGRGHEVEWLRSIFVFFVFDGGRGWSARGGNV